MKNILLVVVVSVISSSAQGTEEVYLEGGNLSGLFGENDPFVPDQFRYSNGFRSLYTLERPLANGPWGSYIHPTFFNSSLYNEHLMNYDGLDQFEDNFSPDRLDPCTLTLLGTNAAQLNWYKENAQSNWQVDQQTVHILSENQIDFQFTETFSVESWGPRESNKDWVSSMFASYLMDTTASKFWFWGKEHPANSSTWIHFGGIIPEGGYDYLPLGVPIDEGSVKHESAPHRGTTNIHENAFNVKEHPYKFFTLPLYVGFVDGDTNRETYDPWSWIMMFDPAEGHNVTFTTFWWWQPEHSTALDWQYTVWSPEIGTEYSYDARIVFKPVSNLGEIVEEYQTFLIDIGYSPEVAEIYVSQIDTGPLPESIYTP